MKNEKLPAYGGQALIEGVLMRGSQFIVAAMRNPSGEIVFHEEKLNDIYSGNLTKIPFLRGLIVLWASLKLGLRYLTLSANVQSGENEKIEGPILYVTLSGSLIIGIVLFFLIPAFSGQFLSDQLGINSWWGNLIEGALRLIIVIAYIWAVGRMPEIKRVFAYHGAEHKTINAYEAGADLTPESVIKFPIEHPRCGTSFILTLVLLSIIIFSAIGPLSLLGRVISRIILLPVLASLAYEYNRWTAKHLNSSIVRTLIRPNLSLQKLTTRMPDLKMVEVGISSLKAVLEREKREHISSENS
jgi:uncharacterized protein YqhQ